jgi:serine/threonine protein kinase
MIGKTIGEGTFGKVKLAVHIPTGEKVSDDFLFVLVSALVVTALIVCCRVSGGHQNIGKESDKGASGC